MTVLVKWKIQNTAATGLRIYRSPSYFTKDSLPTVLAEVSPDVEEYEDTTANVGENWYMISSFLDNGYEVFSQPFIPKGRL